MPYDSSNYITRTPLEGVALDFMVETDGYIADKLFPPKVVDKRKKKIYQADKSKLRHVDTRKGTNAEPNLVDEQLFTRDVDLIEHKLGREINPRDVRDADIPSLLDEGRATRQVTNHLLIDRELEAVTLATTTGNYPSSLTSALSSGSKWNEAGGDPESDMKTINAALRNSCGRDANAIAMSIETYDKLCLSPNFRDRVKYTSREPVNEADLKAYFKVDHVFIAKARYDSAVEGATASIGGFWGANVIAFVYNPSIGLEDLGYGHTYTFNTPFWVDVWEDARRKGSAGAMKRVTVGAEWKLASGYTVGSSDTDFAAGYLLRTTVA